MTTTAISHGFFQAVENNDLETIQKLHAAKKIPDLMTATQDGRRAHEIAIAFPDLRVFKWLVADSKQRIDLTVEHAVILHYTPTGRMTWLLDNWTTLARQNPAWNGLEIPDLDPTTNGNDFIRLIIENGNLSTLDQLARREDRQIDPTDVPAEAMLSAIARGYAQILVWLFVDWPRIAKSNPAWNQQAIPRLRMSHRLFMALQAEDEACLAMIVLQTPHRHQGLAELLMDAADEAPTVLQSLLKYSAPDVTYTQELQLRAKFLPEALDTGLSIREFLELLQIPLVRHSLAAGLTTVGVHLRRFFDTDAAASLRSRRI